MLYNVAMASIEQIKASDGSGNASLATVQNSRSIGATTIIVDTVVGINGAGFAGTMGTPHTFTDPVTSETITVISEATAVDFTGHVDGSNLEIDDIAPGYTDLGSDVGDIVIIRPTTQWSDNVAAVLDAEHEDDGTHGAITPTSVTSTGTITAAKFVRTGSGNGIGWDPLGDTPDTVTYNGNRSYSVVFNGNDLTDDVSVGMRLKLTRTVTAPTQCTDLEAGSSQYYSRASAGITGMTFTDDFVVSAWVKLESYGGVNGLHIASRYNGTSGWTFRVGALGAGDGRIQLAGFNASGANYSEVHSNQSIPLNKWVHITAQLDMSTFTATTTTSYVMIDGVDVPAAVSRAGTNPIALIQAGDLNIGASNGADFFDGKIAQVAIYNAKVTQANIRATVSQGLSGSETSLISAYSFNNSITDLNANANNLTAQGSAVATNADSPFGVQADGTTTGVTEYAEIQATVFSTNTTLTVRVSEGSMIPTTGGVSAVSYSTQASPYGMPAISNVLGYSLLQSSQGSITTETDILGLTITVYVPYGHRIRVSVYANGLQATNTTSPSIFINKDGTTAATETAYVATVSGAIPVNVSYVETPTTGSHTYKVRVSLPANTGTFVASSTSPAYIMVEDLDR